MFYTQELARLPGKVVQGKARALRLPTSPARNINHPHQLVPSAAHRPFALHPVAWDFNAQWVQALSRHQIHHALWTRILSNARTSRDAI